MPVVNTYLNKAIEAKAGYSDLTTNMNDNPNNYIVELTKKDIFGRQSFTLEEAIAFAGVKKVGVKRCQTPIMNL